MSSKEQSKREKNGGRYRKTNEKEIEIFLNYQKHLLIHHHFNIKRLSRVKLIQCEGLKEKRKKRDRAKAYRTIKILQFSLFNQKKLVNKWKQKCHRFTKRCQPDFEQKAEEIIKRGEARKALILHQSILERIQCRYRSSNNAD